MRSKRHVRTMKNGPPVRDLFDFSSSYWRMLLPCLGLLSIPATAHSPYPNDFASVVYMMGVKNAFVPFWLAYLTPLVVLSLPANATSLFFRSRLLLSWPDFALLVLPALVWFHLSLQFPAHKSPANLIELIFLGLLAALVQIPRWRAAGRTKVELSAYGLLGITSLAICCWAFVPKIYPQFSHAY